MSTKTKLYRVEHDRWSGEDANPELLERDAIISPKQVLVHNAEFAGLDKRYGPDQCAWSTTPEVAWRQYILDQVEEAEERRKEAVLAEMRAENARKELAKLRT